MEPYDKYIDTGIDWLGKIPKSWHRTQLRYLTSISKGRKAEEDFQDYKEGFIPYLSMEYLRSQTESPIYVSENDPNIVLVDERDLLILWDGSKAGEIVKAKSGALSSTMGKIHLNSELIDLAYLTYYLKSAEPHIQSNTVGMGIPHVSGDVLKSLAITFPDLNTQLNIISFLNHQTSVVDQLIQQKEKLIDLLKEKRQAVINEAVTKGLDTTAKMKDSGIEWLGEIPMNWEVAHLKRFVIEHRQGFYSSKDYDKSGFRLARITDIKENNILDLSDSPFYDLPESEIKEFILQDGDFVFQRTGAHKKIGVYRGNEPAIYGSFLIRFRFDDSKINTDYLLMYLESFAYQNQLNSTIHGGANPNIHAENIKECLLIVPPREQQEQIVKSYLSIRSKTIFLIEKLVEQIEKLKEYRQSIISEAVTGKIDVRGWQSNTKKVA